MNTRTLYLALFVVGVVLELLCLTLLKGKPDYYTSPMVWILAGLLTVFASGKLLFFAQKEDSETNSTTHIFTTLSIFSILAVVVAFVLTKTFQAHPVNPLESDVIPTIEILVRRMLNGEWVYAPIEFPGWTVNNAYLPLQYFPFVIAEKLHFDYRWLAYLSFLIIVLAWLQYAFRQNISVFENSIKVIFIFLSLLLINKHDNGSFAFSLELIDVAFYMFLALSFFIDNWWIKGIAILCCLLSRYAFVFWLPLYALSFWEQKGQKEALRIVGTVIGGVILLYVLPFLTKQPMLFFDGLKYYDKTAIGQWTDIPSWYAAVGKPFHLTQGLSTSIYFYDFWKGDISAKLGAARTLHGLLCVGSVLLSAVVYWFWRKREDFNYQAFMLVSLKFYFIFFYGFFYVPFSYLYLIPIFYSIAILMKLRFYTQK